MRPRGTNATTAIPIWEPIVSSGGRSEMWRRTSREITVVSAEPSPEPSSRHLWTSLTDSQLLAQVEVDTYRASGPGGQKRNKTSSAVRVRHPASGLIVIAEESRSQHENKAKALRRLRQAFFLRLREPLTDGLLSPEMIAAREDYREA